jgi:branched-chain amino acid transport system substrate-binding protein
VVRNSAMRVLGVMVLLLSGASCSLTDDSADVPDLVVAATLELTGTLADVGTAHQRALRLQEEQINASGVLGERRLRVVMRDNQSNVELAVNQITDFAADSSVSAIISGACSRCGIEGGKVANTKQVPFISLAPSDTVAARGEDTPERNFVFKIGSNGNDSVRALLDQIVPGTTPANAPARKLGVLYPDDQYGTEGVAAAENAITNSGATIVNKVTYKADGSNLKEQAASLLAGKPTAQRPDAVLVFALPPQTGPAAQALKAAGFQGQQVYLDSAAAGGLFLSEPAVEGATIVFPQTLAMDDVIASTPAKASRKQWFEDYTARYGAYHGQASFAADALTAVAAAFDRDATTNRVQLCDVLESMEIDGLSGPLRMTPLNHSALMPQALETLVAKGGRWRLLG